MIPGEVLTVDGDITLNEGRTPVTVTVANTGDRPVQVGSHYHFFEVNPALAFDRAPYPCRPIQGVSALAGPSRPAQCGLEGREPLLRVRGRV